MQLLLKEHPELLAASRIQERGFKQILPQNIQTEQTLPTPWFWTSILSIYEKIALLCEVSHFPVICRDSPRKLIHLLLDIASKLDYVLLKAGFHCQKSSQKKLLFLLCSVKVDLSYVIVRKPIRSWIHTLCSYANTHRIQLQEPKDSSTTCTNPPTTDHQYTAH